MLRLTPGRTAVLLIVVLGASLASFNVWYRYATTNQIHRRWGTDAMLRIAEAPEAEWWELSDTPIEAAVASTNEHTTVGDRTYAIRRRGDLARARGFVHLRHSLGQDASYAWSDEGVPPAEWSRAIVFRDGDARTVVFVDRDSKWLSTDDGPIAHRAVELTDKMSAGLKTFFAEQQAGAK